MTTPSTPSTSQPNIPIWRDERYLQVLIQVGIVAALILLGYFLLRNLFTALQAQGLTPGFGFLSQTSGFDIGESSIQYSRSSTVLRAFTVGLLNTVRVALLGILFATLLGIIVGVARLSDQLAGQQTGQCLCRISPQHPPSRPSLLPLHGSLLQAAACTGSAVASGRLLSVQSWGLHSLARTGRKLGIVSLVLARGPGHCRRRRLPAHPAR